MIQFQIVIILAIAIVSGCDKKKDSKKSAPSAAAPSVANQSDAFSNSPTPSQNETTITQGEVKKTEEVKDDFSDSETPETEDPIQNEDDTDTDPDETEEDPCATLDKQTIDESFEIEDERSCEYGEGDNLEKMSGHLQAVKGSSFSFDLPEGAVACSAQFSLQKQDFHYDDALIVVFNETLVATSHNQMLVNVTEEGGWYPYDWTSMRGTEIDFGDDLPECFGAVDCTMPESDRFGDDLNLLFYDDTFKTKAAESINEAGNAVVTVYAGGDNNNGDCRQNGTSGNLSIEYVTP